MSTIEILKANLRNERKEALELIKMENKLILEEFKNARIKQKENLRENALDEIMSENTTGLFGTIYSYIPYFGR